MVTIIGRLVYIPQFSGRYLPHVSFANVKNFGLPLFSYHGSYVLCLQIEDTRSSIFGIEERIRNLLQTNTPDIVTENLSIFKPLPKLIFAVKVKTSSGAI